MVKGCNYGASVESVLRDQVVLGVADSQTREKLLFEKTLDLSKAFDRDRQFLVARGVDADMLLCMVRLLISCVMHVEKFDIMRRDAQMRSIHAQSPVMRPKPIHKIQGSAIAPWYTHAT